MKSVKLSLYFFLSILFSCTTTPSLQENITVQNSESNSLDLGNKYAHDGLYREAVEQYKKATKQPKHRASALRNLGIVQLKSGDYKGALKSFHAVAKKFEDDFDFHFYKGEAHRGLRQYDQAIFHYQRANQIKPDQVRVLKPLTWSYVQIRYYSRAYVISKTLMKHHQQDPEIPLIVARVLVQTHRYKSARKVLSLAKKGADEKQLAHIRSIEGDIYLAENNLPEAMRSYRATLKKDPLLAGALYGLGKALVADKQVDRGIAYLERAMRVRPDHALTYLELGKAYEQQKKSDKSHAFLQQFIKLSVNDPELHNEAEKIRRTLKMN